MSNEEFLNRMRYVYDALQYFNIEGNLLTFKESTDDQKSYTIHFNHVYLANLNPNLFLLKPSEIFHTLLMLELLPKSELSPNEKYFINSYVNKYLEWNDKALALNNNEVYNAELDNLNITLNGFKIPIYLAYDPAYEKNETAILIQEIMNKHNEELENGRGNQMRLVLTNPNAILTTVENTENFAKAGFTTLILIATAVVATCLYVAYFIAST